MVINEIVSRFEVDTEGVLEQFLYLDVPSIYEVIKTSTNDKISQYSDDELLRCVQYYNQFIQNQKSVFGHRSKNLLNLRYGRVEDLEE